MSLVLYDNFDRADGTLIDDKRYKLMTDNWPSYPLMIKDGSVMASVEGKAAYEACTAGLLNRVVGSTKRVSGRLTFKGISTGSSVTDFFIVFAAFHNYPVPSAVSEVWVRIQERTWSGTTTIELDSTSFDIYRSVNNGIVTSSAQGSVIYCDFEVILNKRFMTIKINGREFYRGLPRDTGQYIDYLRYTNLLNYDIVGIEIFEGEGDNYIKLNNLRVEVDSDESLFFDHDSPLVTTTSVNRKFFMFMR